MGATVEQAGDGQVGDDYALDAVPAGARMHWRSVAVITLGLMGAMIFLQVGGQLALEYGVTNAVLALVYATVVTGLFGSLFGWYAARHGLNSSLITRASGYGHAGARITALFYAANFIALAAVEGSIMASAIHAYLTWLPLWVVEVVLTVVNLALNWYGIRLLERFQKFSLPVYLLLLAAAVIAATRTAAAHGAPLPHGLSGTGVLAGIGVCNGIVGLQSLLTADYARFTREPRIGRMLLIGFIPQIASFLVMGLIGIWLATRFRESDPGIYLVLVMGAWGAIYTVVTQLRINVINIYSSSLSLQGFFGYFLPRANSRQVWVVASAGLALLAMLFGILAHVGDVLTFLGSFMFAWVGTLVAELLVVRRGPARDRLEFRAERLPAWGRTGFPAVVVGALAGGWCALFSGSPTVNAVSGFIAGGVAFALHLVLALALAPRRQEARV
jgi:purine-cytosine permease-like protein